MKTLAFDASTSKTGYAIVVDGAPVLCRVWKPPTKLKRQHERITALGQFAKALIMFEQPDLVVIEECGPTRNSKVFRALVRAEAVVGYEADLAGKDVLLVMVKAVREVAMGDGKMGKETVYAKLSQQWPEFDWKPIDKGGDDMSDALAMALAGEQLRDRR